MFVTATLVCIAVACAYVALWLHGRRARRLLKDLPTLPTLPFLGNIHQILGDGPVLFGTLEFLTKICEDTGKPFACWIGPRPAIVTSDPDDVRAITNAFVEKPYYYGFARYWVGNGLVTAPGHIWKRNIKALAGTFTSSIVDGYQGVFSANAAILVDKLRAEVGGQPFNVYEYLSYATLETICQTALGVPRISQSIVTTEYYHAFNKIFELLIRRSMNIFYHLDAVYQLSSQYRELMACVRVLHNVSETIMTKRKEERLEMKRNGKSDHENNNSENGKHRFKAFLDILLELGELDPTMTEQQIKAEVDTIIVGGQETVSTTMFMTLLVVGSRPRIQEKMVQELKEIFGDSKRPIEKDDLARMHYCEAVINETLRIYPPIPCILRDADKDLQIKSCTIPKGASCAVNAWGAGRSRRTWGPDALEYRPERWLEGDPPASPATFLAFSYGRRACIGKRYAYCIMKTILGTILRELEVTSNIEQVKFKLDVSLKAISGHLITVRQRG